MGCKPGYGQYTVGTGKYLSVHRRGGGMRCGGWWSTIMHDWF